MTVFTLETEHPSETDYRLIIISSVKTANKNQFLIVAKTTDKKIHSFQLSFVSQPLAVLTLETDHLTKLSNQ